MTRTTPAANHPWRNSYRQVLPRSESKHRRTCRSCGEVKPIEAFAPSGSGYRTVCRDCHNAERRANPEDGERKNARARDLYSRRPEVKIAANKRYRHRQAERRGQPYETPPRRWLTITAASILLGRSESFVRVRCVRGVLVAKKFIEPESGGYGWRIDPASVEKLRGEL